MSVPQLSGDSFVSVLKKHGFKTLAKRGSHTVLRKGKAKVIVPDASILAHSTLTSLLEHANVPYEKFSEWVSNQKIKKEEEPKEEKEIVENSKKAEKMSFIKNAWFAETKAAPVALLRVVIGFLFFSSALSKAPWNDFGWFGKAVQNNIDFFAFGFWRDFNLHVVQQNLALFGWLQFLIEFAIGFLLIVGLLTVLTSFLGQFWVLIIWVSAAAWPDSWVWTYIMLFLMMFLFWTAKAGRSFGLDQIIQDKVGAYEEHSKFYRFLSWLI